MVRVVRLRGGWRGVSAYMHVGERVRTEWGEISARVGHPVRPAFSEGESVSDWLQS